MRHRGSRVATLVAIACLTFLTGCASSGGGGGPAGQDAGRGTIEMQIWNRSDETIAVFARWGTAPRVRLGQLRGNRRGTYLAYVQGPLVAISWDVLSARPPAPTAFGGAFPDVADSPGDPQCGVDVSPGDRVEWRIESDSRTCDYIRLDPGTF